jgi:stage V sporulation protein SpoVS
MVVNLRLSRPSYRLTGAVKGLIWQSGKVDAEGFVEASGAGAQLLATLNAEGKFSGEGVDLGVQPAWQSVSGAFRVTWAGGAPRLRFTDLELAAGDDDYTGRGGTAEDGRLILLLTDGTREVRATGTLARLKVEEPRP